MGLIRRVFASGWLAAWAGLLWLLIRPWRDLGGIADERWIWATRFFTACLVVVGVHVGRWGREWAAPGRGRTHFAFHRRAWWAVSVPVTAVMLAAAAVPSMEGALLTAAVFAGYWAGLDAGLAIFPLFEGQAYTVRRPLPPVAEVDTDSESSWLPPWERL